VEAGLINIFLDLLHLMNIQAILRHEAFFFFDRKKKTYVTVIKDEF